MKKTFALTCGDPNSIATFISLKAWLQLNKKDFNFIFIGNKDNIDKVISYFNLPIKTKAITIKDLQDKNKIHELFSEFFLVFNFNTSIEFSLGNPIISNAEYVLESIKVAVNLVERSLADAIVTNPIDKNLINQYLQKKHYNKLFLGHTEYLSDISNKKPTIMMLCSNESNLRVVPLTTHVSLKHAIHSLSTELIINKTIEINKFLKKHYKITSPLIAILGLNPHSGENGLMGDEEINIINPAIKKLQELDLKVYGAVSADSCCTKYNLNNSDVIIGMYHDQVLTPFKTLHFDSGVNVTIGLDFIRTSPDHGVSFNIAKSDQASEKSLVASLSIAYNLTNP